MMNTSAELNLGLAEDRIMSAPKGLVKGYILNKAEFEKFENGGLGLTDMVSKSIEDWLGDHISDTDMVAPASTAQPLTRRTTTPMSV